MAQPATSTTPLRQGFASLQWARAIAAVAVVLYHCGQAIEARTGLPVASFTNFGAAGVDVFFVISGLIMTLTTRRQAQFSATDFLMRRIIRIVPIYWFYTLLKSAILFADPGASLYSQLSGGHLVASLLFIPMAEPRGIVPILVVGWTLNCEAFFYVLFAASKVIMPSRSMGLLSAILAALAASHSLVGHGFAPATLWTEPIMLEFAFGIGAAELYLRGLRPSAMLTAGLVLLGATGLFLLPEVAPWRWVLWGIPAACLVFGMLSAERFLNFSRFRVLTVLGDSSYSLYLTHTIVIPVFASALLKITLPPAMGIAWLLPPMTAGCIVVGLLSYRLLELPVTRAFQKMRNRKGIPENAKRDIELDALRGLAAFSVLLFHSWLVLPESWHSTNFAATPEQLLSLSFLLRFTPLHLLIAGPSCVALFFVLSGYVLSISMSRASPFRYKNFVIRRICRIYLPFVAAILCSAVAYFVIAPEASGSASHWFETDQWSVAPSPQSILGHLLMIGTPDLQSLDPPMWSLVIEMRVSLIFPFLYMLLMVAPRLGATLIMIFYAAASVFMTTQRHSVPTTFIESCAVTIEFLPFFAIGVLMFRARARIGLLYSTMPVTLRRIALVTGVLLLGMPSIGPETSISVISKAAWLVGVGFGSFAAIALALESGLAGRMLRLSPAQWLGKVSFSLYLTHMIVLFCLIHGLQEKLPLPVTLCLALLVSFVVAALAHWLIEAPANRLGYALTRRQHGAPATPQPTTSGLEQVPSAH